MIPMDWTMGLIGGLMIGGAAALFLLVNGRIMGASGVLGGLVDGSGRANWTERAVFVAAVVLAPLIAILATGSASMTHLTDNWVIVVLAGLCVGVGTRMANGCTSGHGVCGISRYSVRGIVATLAYLTAGGLAMYLARHVLGVV